MAIDFPWYARLVLHYNLVVLVNVYTVDPTLPPQNPLAEILLNAYTDLKLRDFLKTSETKILAKFEFQFFTPVPRGGEY